MSKQHTLERIVNELGSKYDDEALHAALLLSYAHSIYSVIRRDCTPSPLYRIFYDENTNMVSLDETYGLSLPTKEGALDISVVDNIFCCNVRDIPLLLEGETGIGKTYAAIKYLSTVFEKGQFFSHRLSVNAFVNNLFTHFQKGKMVDGMPVIEPRIDVIETTAAGIVDEINRGDSNETLQLFDNEMHLEGSIYKLGVPIPDITVKDSKVAYLPKNGRKKKLLIVCAQNPAGTDDAKFTQTIALDAAVDNRLLKTYVGNAAASAGTTLWLGDGSRQPHDEFIDKFSKKAARYLGIPDSAFADIKTDWLSTYAWITDSARTDKPILYSALELSDFMIAVFSGNLIKYFNYEKNVINEWNKKIVDEWNEGLKKQAKGLSKKDQIKLVKYTRKDVKINSEIHETDIVKQIHEVTASFKIPIIFRDIVQINKLADVLSTLKNVKDAFRNPNPVESYVKAEKYVTVREIAGATALLARNKQTQKSLSPLNAINQVLQQYIGLTEDYIKNRLFAPKFTLFDPNASIKKVAVYHSAKKTITQSEGIDYFIQQLTEEANVLTGKLSASEELKNILIARSVADIMTLCGFLNKYKKELDPIMKAYDKKKTDPQKVIDDLSEFYYQKLDELAMVMPEEYQHRIQRTLGL